MNPTKDLLEYVERDLEPVTPLPASWRRMLNALAVAVAIFLLAVLFFGLRPDLDSLPMWLTWGCAAAQLTVATLLIRLGLRESVPGQGVPMRSALAAVISSFVFQLAVGFLTWRVDPTTSTDLAAGVGPVCMRHELLLAAPVLAITLLMIFRAFPLRSWMAGLLGGVGSAIAADAVTHLQCPISDLRHLLIWHSGAIILVAIAGAALGFFWGRLRG